MDVTKAGLMVFVKVAKTVGNSVYGKAVL